VILQILPDIDSAFREYLLYSVRVMTYDELCVCVDVLVGGFTHF